MNILALHGGSPVRTAPMPARKALGAAERAMVAEILDHYADRGEDPGYQGVYEARYCAEFATLLGGGCADAVATGTAALFVALAALDLPRGSEVIVSPITDPGTLSAIILNGLRPRLADSMPDSFNIGPAEMAQRCGPATSAVVVVHSLGRAAPIDAIVATARERGLRVVEDCSQSHGALWRGRPVGTFGDIAAFSTMYRKAHITGASGGVVYSRDTALFRRAQAHADRGKPRWRDGFDDRDPGQFLFPALNLHTDEISCAIGLASLARLEETRRRRLAFVAAFAELLGRRSRLCRVHDWSDEDSPFVLPVHVAAGTDAQAFGRAVLAEGIGLNPHYRYLAADWPWLRPYLAEDFPTPRARALRDGAFMLYLNENYGSREAEDAVAAIVKVEDWLAAMEEIPWSVSNRVETL